MRTSKILQFAPILLVFFCLLLAASPTPGLAQQEADVTPLDLEEGAETEPADHEDNPPWLEAFNKAFKDEGLRLETEGKIRTADVTPLSETDPAVVRAAERADVADAATPIALPGDASTLRDFLSFLVAGTDLGHLSEEGSTVVIQLNPKFFDFGGGQGSGTVKLREPEVSERLLMALPEAVRAERKTSLQDDLGELDDVEVALSWARETRRIGRDPSDHQQLLDRLADYAVATFDEAGVLAVQDLLWTLDRGLEPTTEQASAAGRRVAQGLAEFHGMLERDGYFKAGELISNQPQLHASFTGRFREELAGQDELALSITWEGGVGNVNGLAKRCSKEGGGRTDWATLVAQPEFLGCYTGFVETSNPEWSRRWKLKAEYSETQSDTIDLPDDDLSLDLASAETIRVIGGFGFDLPLLPEFGNSPPRIDFEGTWEKVSNSEVRNDDRLVGSLTFTQKVSESSAATLSLIYANKPELLGEVDEELSARVGLKFSIDTGDDE